MLELLNAILWGPGTVGLLLGTGAWLTLRTGAFPQRMLPLALRLSLGREARRKGNNGVSPFGSLMTALASTVGTGNIVGVAAALVSGGPGALVWMELAALLERLEREYHKKRIYLSVVEANRPAAALYESFGFRFTGERDTHGERVMCLRTR